MSENEILARSMENMFLKKVNFNVSHINIFQKSKKQNQRQKQILSMFKFDSTNLGFQFLETHITFTVGFSDCFLEDPNDT